MVASTIRSVLLVLFVIGTCCLKQFVHGQSGCAPNPCYNGGICYYIASGSKYYPVCSCAPGFTGYNCLQRISTPCTYNPCLNGGTCYFNNYGQPTCTCPPGTTGTICVKDVCAINRCVNGGSCMSTASGQTYCSCTSYYTGKYCEYAVNSPCAISNPCQNGGTCFYTAGAYSCLCLANYYGNYCQVKATKQTCTAQDTNQVSCKIYASQNFCSMSYSFQWIPIPVYCPASCGACTRVRICEDDQSGCAYWAALGMCSIITDRNPNQCKRSCGNCGDLA